MTMRTYRPRWLRILDKILHPRRTMRRSIKGKLRKVKKRAFGKRAYRPLRKELQSRPRVGLLRHDIVPGRTIVEWLNAPELGRGIALAFLPGQRLDIRFDCGARPPAGVAIEEVRVLRSY